MPGTSDVDRPLMLAGQPLHEVLRARAPQLARTMTGMIADEVETYRRMSEKDLYSDILALVEASLEMVAHTFEHRRPPPAEAMAELHDAAGRGVADNVPLEDILSAYHLGGRLATAALFAECDPQDYGDVVAAYSLLLDFNQTVSAVVCAGYSEARESIRSQEQDARHAVVSALLKGERPNAAGALAGVRLASRYLVLTVGIGRHPDESGDRTAAVYAGRSKLDRIRAVLDSGASDPVLTVLDTAGGLVLVPAPEGTLEWPQAAELVASMAAAAGADIWAAGELAGIADIAPAAGLTQEVLDVVTAFGHPAGLYRLADVLLEYQLTRPSKAMSELARLLDPLEGNPDLLHTLQVYLETGLDRRRTAALLHIHPNTVDYRLRRAVRLTGLDPVDPAQQQRIGAALAARRTLSD